MPTKPTVPPELRKVLLSAYSTSAAQSCPCSMRWAPAHGHIPRGFCGATGGLTEVALVLVCAEPGDPHPHESYPGDSPDLLLESAYDHAYTCFKTGTDLFHRNIRHILALCFPGTTFDEQMRRAWITNSVLCSARTEGGQVPAIVARTCRSRYLDKQIQLFPQAVVAALGKKAQERLTGLPREVVAAVAAAPPGCNHRTARPSWQCIADQVHERSFA